MLLGLVSYFAIFICLCSVGNGELDSVVLDSGDAATSDVTSGDTAASNVTARVVTTTSHVTSSGGLNIKNGSSGKTSTEQTKPQPLPVSHVIKYIVYPNGSSVPLTAPVGKCLC